LVLSEIAINSSADIAHTNAPIEEDTHRVIGMLALTGVRCMVDVGRFLFNSTSDLGLFLTRNCSESMKLLTLASGKWTGRGCTFVTVKGKATYLLLP